MVVSSRKFGAVTFYEVIKFGDNVPFPKASSLLTCDGGRWPENNKLTPGSNLVHKKTVGEY
jgi:hypothetical protein